jgi:co-chaperonin GroES (HSP10)
MTEGAQYEETTLSAADIMTAKDAHGMVQETYRPMRGQAYVQMMPEYRGRIILDQDENKSQSHQGRIIALGPPARLGDSPDAPEVPWLCEVGDEIVYSMFVWLDKFRVFAMLGVKGEVCVVAQGEVCGVVTR